jgi:putative redox protein
MKARIKWNEGVSFIGEAGSGHAVVIDGAPEDGGRNLGLRPMELVLIGAGACAAFHVLVILKRARQPVVDCVVDAEARRAESVPRVFTRIHLRYTVAGQRLDPHKVERAVSLSKTKYCSATIMLGESVEVTTEIRLVDALPPAD